MIINSWVFFFLNLKKKTHKKGYLKIIRAYKNFYKKKKFSQKVAISSFISFFYKKPLIYNGFLGQNLFSKHDFASSFNFNFFYSDLKWLLFKIFSFFFSHNLRVNQREFSLSAKISNKIFITNFINSHKILKWYKFSFKRFNIKNLKENLGRFKVSSKHWNLHRFSSFKWFFFRSFKKKNTKKLIEFYAHLRNYNWLFFFEIDNVIAHNKVRLVNIFLEGFSGFYEHFFLIDSLFLNIKGNQFLNNFNYFFLTDFWGTFFFSKSTYAFKSNNFNSVKRFFFIKSLKFFFFLIKLSAFYFFLRILFFFIV